MDGVNQSGRRTDGWIDRQTDIKLVLDSIGLYLDIDIPLSSEESGYSSPSDSRADIFDDALNCHQQAEKDSKTMFIAQTSYLKLTD